MSEYTSEDSLIIESCKVVKNDNPKLLSLLIDDEDVVFSLKKAAPVLNDLSDEKFYKFILQKDAKGLKYSITRIEELSDANEYDQEDSNETPLEIQLELQDKINNLITQRKSEMIVLERIKSRLETDNVLSLKKINDIYNILNECI